MPDSVPDPTRVTAARAVRLAEIQARADEPVAFDALNLALQDLFEPSYTPTFLHEDYGYGDLAIDIMAAMRAHGFDAGALLGEVRCLTGERDRARDVAVALEQECAEAWRQRNRLFRACERYAVPESAIREACTPAAGGVS